MAKLDVKVIDMVNGEITKVSYKGSEYALVSGNGKIGDLAQCNRVHAFFTKGEFYEVTEISEEGEWVHAIDDEYDRYHMDVTKSAKLFRKISAQTTPTIEERVSKLEVDVEALKGEQAIESPYIPQNGDIVVVVANNTLHANKIGDIGKVGEEKPLRDGGVCVYVPNGPASAIRTLPKDIRKATPSEVAAYEQAVKNAEKKAKQAKESAKWAKIGRKPGEFKRGDIVRVLAHKHGRKIGEIGVVENPGTVRIGIRFGDRQFVAITESNEEAELITPVDARFDK